MESAEKGQVVIYDDWKKRRRGSGRRPTLASVVFIAAIIVLASLSIVMYGSSEHYRESKYRSQYWQVVSLANSITLPLPAMNGILDTDRAEFERYSFVVFVESSLSEAEDLAYSLQLMYHDDDTVSSAFGGIHEAIEQTQRVVGNFESRLYSAITHNTSYEANSTVISSISNLTGLMRDLSAQIYAGVDSSQDFLKDPYSLVKRMDLVAIEDISAQILAMTLDLTRWM